MAIEETICKRTDPICPSNLVANAKVTWLPTNTEFIVCIPCAEAIVKRSQRNGGLWK